MAAKYETSERLTESIRVQENLQVIKSHNDVKVRFPAVKLLVSALYRILEFGISIVVIMFLALPLGIVLWAVRVATGRKVFYERKIVGQNGVPITIRYFNVRWSPASRLALYMHVLSGKLSLISSSIKPFSENNSIPENGYLNSMKPGLVSLWQVRKNCNIGHEGFLATEWEYCFTRSRTSDIFILLRSIPTHFYTSNRQSATDTTNLFGVQFANLTMHDGVENVRRETLKSNSATSIFFVNPDCLNKSISDPSYLQVLQEADYVFPDGIGLTIACKMLRSPLRENINGTDMLPFLCEMAVENDLSFFLLGAKQGVAEAVSDRLREKYGISVAGTHHGYFDHRLESQQVVKAINQSGADIVLVAFGAPLQEKWISANKASLQAGVVMGVGGLFDFYSGNIRRAPRWLRELGLEWIYRLMQEPGRMWRRYVIGNPLFLFRVLVWKAKQAKKN